MKSAPLIDNSFSATLPRILRKVQAPGQYIGGEPNVIIKPEKAVRLRFALAFPDLYTVGMSNLGMQIIYDIANRLDGIACERVFAPQPDMETQMRCAAIPLSTLETHTPLAMCDVVGFSVGYELSAPAILAILDLGGIPLLNSERRPGHPLVIAGGQCVANPEPLTDFIDAFFIGEAEDALPDILHIIATAGGKNCPDRHALLERLANEVQGVYAPTLYRTETTAEGFLAIAPPVRPTAPWPIKRRIVMDFENAPIPIKPVVPLVEAVHERFVLEIQRGCPHGCRFCQAGVICRPWRPRSVNRLLEAARAGIRATGYDEIGLLSLSTGDYPHLEKLAMTLEEEFAPQKVSLSLPSLRVDDVLRHLPRRFCAVRRSGLTFAPETGSEALRASVNKHVSNEALLAAAAAAYRHGWRTLKLYFMIGLPGETEEDVAAIAALANQVAKLRPHAGGIPAVHLAVSNFVPKPHTAFQWDAMAKPEVLRAKAETIARHIDRRRVEFKCHDLRASHWEGVLARGDRRLGKAILRAWQLGARLDAWSEHFQPERWEQAMQEHGLDSNIYACRERGESILQPWSHIDIGVSTEFLKKERAKARLRQPTPSCSETSCGGCGLAICPWRGDYIDHSS